MNDKHVEWIMRIGIFGTFLGHGLFALSNKQAWYSYFSVIGITEASTIGTLLLLIGIMDLIVALLMLVRPFRGILAWAVVWGFVTALIRPLSGEFFSMDFWDLVERAANFLLPLALIAFYGWPQKARDWLTVR